MIKFGTDGWRGVIADDFTFDNVRIVTQAICDYMREQRAESTEQEQSAHRSPLTAPKLVIGYDTRFLSDRFARATAEVAAGNGIKVLLTESFAPTPAVSYAVVDRQTDGAIMITASHNPYKYNGLKFKAPYGGSASPEITGAIEKCLERNAAAGREPKIIDYSEAVSGDLIELFDPKVPYLARLAELVDTEELRGKRIGAVIDPMYGAGRGYLSDFLRRAGCNISEINDYDEPYFGHSQPEPIAENLVDLMRAVCGEWPVGIALDGDADRIGAVDFLGDFVTSHVIIALLLRYLYEEKGMSGDVIKTVSTTGLIDILAADFGLTVLETPIGFKHICDAMLAGDVLIGGEESGGIGVKGHIPERDGILMGALLIEMMCHYNLSLGELWRDMQKKYGCFYYGRTDVVVSADEGDAIAGFMDNFRPDEILGIEVATFNGIDGYKFSLVDKSWLMIRPSGTEPLVRIYAEAVTLESVENLLRFGKVLINGAI